MQNFLKVDRIDQKKELVVDRLQNFQEIYQKFSVSRSANQAERCVQCGDPYCSAVGCPLGNYIPHWLKAVAEKDLNMAFLISNETSPFPEILGRICPQDKLCEGACTLGDDGYGAVTIGGIETAITHHGFEKGLELPFPGVTSKKRVAVIGSGPAGMAAATFLLRAGLGVTMYEKDRKPGGLLTYGIPGFKLDKDVVKKRYEILKEAGLKLKLQCEVGKDISFKEIEEKFDSVFIGVGAREGRYPNIEGERDQKAMLSMDFLSAVQERNFKEELDPRFDVSGKNVVVIGGGDTAMDCVRSSIREGASKVTCVYRRDSSSMPGSKKEYINAKEEGVFFKFNKAPKAFDPESSLLSIQSTVVEVCKETKKKSLKILDDEESIPCDVLIFALGFSNQNKDYLEGVSCGSRDEIETKESLETSKKSVFAGGDCIRGADLAVNAARDGREAAFKIIEELL